ncbi:DUF222 domain-containing protein, partial [Kribbella antiqua]|uniref:DUF222 domain-containing protein n=1 Tax=Kribbella antiqua TaxID=2512217 RepID=UPI00104BE25B
MFDGDLTSLPTPELLESAAEHRAEENRRAARLIEHAQIFADRHHPDVCAQRPGRRSSDGRERAVVLGGEGCPEIAEFAPAEFGVMIGVSAGAAAHYIGQALALRHRLPFTWARVQAGEATPWKARKIATACLDLSEEAARAVDRRVAKIVDSLTPDRLEKIVEAAKKHADPEGARKNAEEKAQERGVYVSRSDEHGTKKIFIRTSSGNALLFNAKIGRIAAALKDIGDTRNLQHRRSEAVGIITDSHYTEELLRQARNQRLTNPTNSDHPVPEPSNPTNQTGAPTSTTRKPAAPTSHQASTPPAPRTAHADSGPHPAGKSTAARSAGEDAGVTSNPAATPTEVPGPHTDAASTSHHDVATSRAGRPSEARGAGEDAGSVSDHDVPTSRAGRPSEARGAGEDAGSVSDHDVPTSRAG